MSKNFYIIGCQRSGTTLLRLILESHTEISCFDEPKSYDLLRDKQKLASIISKESDKKWIGFKIPILTEQLANKKLHDYSLPYELVNFYQKETLVFVIRDVRDVICSMKNLLVENSTWLHHWGVPIVEYWIKNSVKFRNEFDSEIKIAKNSTEYELSMASLYWKYKNKSYFRYLKLGNFPIIKIIYEDLVKQSKETINSIIEFLGLEWEDSLLQHHRLDHKETDERGLTVGNTNVHLPIGRFHVGRYKNELNENQLNEIMSISGDLMKSFGYNF